MQQLSAQNTFFDAIRNGDVKLVNRLIAEDEEVLNKANTSGHSPLIIAAYHNQLEIVSLLIEKEVDLNYSFSQGNALHGACFKGHFEVAKRLVISGIEINSKDENGSTPIIYATLFRHEKLAEFLFKNGANPTLKDNTGDSAVDYAKSLGLENLVHLYSSFKNE